MITVFPLFNIVYLFLADSVNKYFPPHKITDLIIENIDHNQEIVTLSFTATGAENDVGTGKLYLIKLCILLYSLSRLNIIAVNTIKAIML